MMLPLHSTRVNTVAATHRLHADIFLVHPCACAALGQGLLLSGAALKNAAFSAGGRLVDTEGCPRLASSVKASDLNCEKAAAELAVPTTSLL